MEDKAQHQTLKYNFKPLTTLKHTTMAVIGIIIQNNKATVSISGQITPSTQKLMDAYTKKHKLDVHSTTIKNEYGVNPSYLK